MGLDYRVRCCPDGLMTDRRRGIKVVDCTIRDGGCTNKWQFSDPLVRDTFRALSQAGVDVMEIGYQTTPGLYSRDEMGPWRFCDEDALRRVYEDTKMQVACMVDMGRFNANDLRPAEDSVVDIIRVATYAKDIDKAIDLLHAAKDQGYEVFCNVMAVTRCTPHQVDAFLQSSAIATSTTSQSWIALALCTRIMCGI